jgi:hypothetical protein
MRNKESFGVPLTKKQNPNAEKSPKPLQLHQKL